MAVFDGRFYVGDYQITVWMDPKRYRAMIAKKSHSSDNSYLQPVRRMHDASRDRLIDRIDAWVADATYESYLRDPSGARPLEDLIVEWEKQNVEESQAFQSTESQTLE